MNAELIAVLEHMEREKGVSRTVLLEAIQQALESAARKVMHDKEGEVEVKINPETGDISVLCEGKKIESNEFGRIAAQTAKQVIIQKIREAERDAIFDEFHTKVNSIVSGTVYRHDKGLLIIDLGRTEAILPRKEQSPRDGFRQGDRARLYVLEVNKTAKGPQVVVSRTHPGLVRKLFEMEVPEVLEGIVEIKEVARDPGDRSKIAVWSKDEKVDCVGACVGVRGMRVKNIVRELQGEKIDIVRWNEDIAEYVKAALSPAQCSQVTITNQEEKKIVVIVDDDQLSLAIGKSGQNVRLAAKLTRWMIDIKSKKELANEKLEAHTKKTETKTDSPPLSLTSLEGVGPKVKAALEAASLNEVAQIAALTTEALQKIEGIGAKTAQKILDSAQNLIAETQTDAAPPAPEVSAPPAPEVSATVTETESTKEETSPEEKDAQTSAPDKTDNEKGKEDDEEKAAS